MPKTSLLRSVWSAKGLFCLLSMTVGCCRIPREITPCLEGPPHPKEIQRERGKVCKLPADFSISPFLPLTYEELSSDWGKEYKIGLSFATDFDLYRAITAFKRALCLLPDDLLERRQEIEYAVTLSYYLGKKYIEVVLNVETTDLACVDATFPAFGDLLIILYDSYQHLDNSAHAENLMKLMQEPCMEKLSLLRALQKADFEALQQEARACPSHAYLDTIISGYKRGERSICKAEVLNALLPGAGYAYVGMPQTAVTAFLINGLFIFATAQFMTHGYWAAGAVTLSLEAGWYFGGIYGAGLAAKAYNERLYCDFANKVTEKETLYPLLQLNYTF